MKKIFNTYISQTFKWYDKWLFYKPKHLKENFEEVTAYDQPTLANTPEEAIEKYVSRYETEFDRVADVWWMCFERGGIKCYDFVNEVKAYPVMHTFNYLKEHMRADEFLEYCKQELNRDDILIDDN